TLSNFGVSFFFFFFFSLYFSPSVSNIRTLFILLIAFFKCMLQSCKLCITFLMLTLFLEQSITQLHIPFVLKAISNSLFATLSPLFWSLFITLPQLWHTQNDHKVMILCILHHAWILFYWSCMAPFRIILLLLFGHGTLSKIQFYKRQKHGKFCGHFQIKIICYF
ncbi:hypothetical protein ES319_D03G043600v1, partial [Gossypium barbadense]